MSTDDNYAIIRKVVIDKIFPVLDLTHKELEYMTSYVNSPFFRMELSKIIFEESQIRGASLTEKALRDYNFLNETDYHFLADEVSALVRNTLKEFRNTHQ